MQITTCWATGIKSHFVRGNFVVSPSYPVVQKTRGRIWWGSWYVYVYANLDTSKAYKQGVIYCTRHENKQFKTNSPSASVTCLKHWPVIRDFGSPVRTTKDLNRRSERGIDRSETHEKLNESSKNRILSTDKRNISAYIRLYI